MIELTAWGDLLRGIGLLYWLVAFGSLIYAIRKARGKRGWARWRPIGLVLLIFFALPVGRIVTNQIDHYQRKAKLDKAMARFEALCKTSGEFIHRTIDDVEGVFLMKLRPSQRNWNGLDAVDPYGFDFDGSGSPYGNRGYIESFLSSRNEKGFLSFDIDELRTGYRYVDLISPEDGKRYRYTAHMGLPANRGSNTAQNVMQLKRVEITNEMKLPRYAVTYDDITRPEDRQLWIASSSLRVIDLETGEVLGERVGHMIDSGQGSTAAARTPWGWAGYYGPACPKVHSVGQTREFVEKIVRISGENK